MNKKSKRLINESENLFVNSLLLFHSYLCEPPDDRAVLEVLLLGSKPLTSSELLLDKISFRLRETLLELLYREMLEWLLFSLCIDLVDDFLDFCWILTLKPPSSLEFAPIVPIP